MLANLHVYTTIQNGYGPVYYTDHLAEVVWFSVDRFHFKRFWDSLHQSQNSSRIIWDLVKRQGRSQAIRRVGSLRT